MQQEVLGNKHDCQKVSQNIYSLLFSVIRLMSPPCSKVDDMLGPKGQCLHGVSG